MNDGGPIPPSSQAEVYILLVHFDLCKLANEWRAIALFQPDPDGLSASSSGSLKILDGTKDKEPELLVRKILIYARLSHQVFRKICSVFVSKISTLLMNS